MGATVTGTIHLNNVSPQSTTVLGNESAMLLRAVPIALISSSAGTQQFALSAVDASMSLSGGVYYRVASDVDCNVNIGAAASTGTMAIFAREPEIMLLGPSGSTPVLHALAVTGSGRIWMTPLA